MRFRGFVLLLGHKREGEREAWYHRGGGGEREKQCFLMVDFCCEFYEITTTLMREGRRVSDGINNINKKKR